MPFLNIRLGSRIVSKSCLRFLEIVKNYQTFSKCMDYDYCCRDCDQIRRHGKQTLPTHLVGIAYCKPLLVGRRERNCDLSQLRYLSYESNSGPPVQVVQPGLYNILSECPPVLKTQELLVQFHDLSGLPWWATVIVSTVALRTAITMPLAIYQYHIMAKVENLTSEMSAIVEELKRETAIAIKKFNWTPKEARITYNRSVRKQWNKLVVRDNCHPAKASILLFVQLPLWIFISFALRNLVFMLPHHDQAAQLTFLEMSLSHFLWIPNLTIPDASWILPITLGLTNLAIIELQCLSKVKEPGKVQKFVTNFFRVLSIGMIPIAASVPACLSLYWVTSSACGLIQNVALMSPRVKKMCGIPRTASTLSHPYQHVATQFKKKTAWLFRWNNNKS